MCQICGLPQNIPCECESQQPFCDQCSDTSDCLQVMDSQCVFYHLTPDPRPSKLTCLGIPNNSRLETILEAIDTAICNSVYKPLIVVDTDSVDLDISGTTTVVLSANVRISGQPGNVIQILSDGLFAGGGAVGDGKVKVDGADFPDYLNNKLIGGTDSIVSISTFIDGSGHLVQVQPSLDINALLDKIINTTQYRNKLCQAVNFCSGNAPVASVTCGDIVSNDTYTLGIASTGTVSVPVTVSGTGNFTVTITASGGHFTGTVTQFVTTGTTTIIVPLSYDGLGSAGSQSITVSFSGSSNPISPCIVTVVVNSATCNSPTAVSATLSPGSSSIFVDVNIAFTSASPAPSNGYIVTYRVKGSVGGYTQWPSNFFSSPAVLTDLIENDYEGFIQSDCGGGVFSGQVAWSTNMFPSLTEISNVPSGSLRTQVAQVGPSVAAGNKFHAQVYSHSVVYTASGGDTPTTVATNLKNLINATSEATWNDHGFAPPHGTPGFPPTATSSGDQITIVLNFGNQFAFGADFS